MTLRDPDPKFWKRLLVAFALAIAIHEIVIGAGSFLRFTEPSKRPLPQATTIIVIAPRIKVAVATPTPSPKPTATPTIPPRVTPAPKVAIAAPRATTIARKHSGGSRGGPKLEVHVPKTVFHSTPVPVVHATATAAAKLIADSGTGASPTPGPAAGNGLGTGSGAGSGNEQGPGGGAGGTGSGPANAAVPCGEPIFYGLRAKFNPKDGSFDEDVRVELHMANGQKVTGDFHYPWHYPSERDNPFSANWRGGPDDPIPAKLPPPGFDVSKEPLAVQLTFQNTLPNGTTRFAPCPSAKSP